VNPQVRGIVAPFGTALPQGGSAGSNPVGATLSASYFVLAAPNPKQPYYFTRVDGGLITFAGIWERWRDKTRPEDDPDAWITSCAIITTKAADDISRIHDRMPVCVPAEAWGAWLDPSVAGSDLLHLLEPSGEGLHAYPVGTTVNTARNNGGL
jgi:putative SOS response-associated peptidase YedK